MDKNEILNIVRQQLAGNLNCSVNEFINEGIFFVANDIRKKPFLEITTMGKGIVISASSEILLSVQNLLDEKSREEIFEFPFIYGQSIYYIPDLKVLKEIPLLAEYEFELLEGKDIQKLQGIKGFENSLVFDKNGYTNTGVVLYAIKDGEIIGLASASVVYEKMWEVGIDVKLQYRKDGLATLLVSNLSMHILNKGIIPFYCAASSNIGSQAVAHRSGFIPCWISTYRNILDGSSSFNNIIGNLKL